MTQTILSSKESGVVVSTASAAFAPEKTLSAIKKLIPASCIKDWSVARTGSSYIMFVLNNVHYDVRIANHSKRRSEPTTNGGKVVIESFEYWADHTNRDLGYETVLECEYQILNGANKKTFIEHLKSVI